MTLDQIKQDILDVLDKAETALSGTADVETARAVVADTTTALSGHVTAAGQQLYDHVVANAEQATAGAVLSPGETGVASNPGGPGQETAAEIDPSGGPATGADGPAETPGGTQMSDGAPDPTA